MEESSPNVHGVGCWLNERVDLVKFRAVMQYLAHHHSSLANVEENGSTSVFFCWRVVFFPDRLGGQILAREICFPNGAEIV
jgi:hypothetical protein